MALNYLNAVRELRRVQNRVFDIRQAVVRPERVFEDRRNPFERYSSEDKFRLRYRMSRETAIMVIEMVRDELERPTKRNHALPVHIQVLAALRFYAVGSFQKMHGDNDGFTQSTMSRVVVDVSTALARRRREFVKFPSTNEEIRSTQEAFYGYANFPGVVGAIDCTHIPIKCPGKRIAAVFINRKNTYSINTQVVCNQDAIITNIVARWQGSAHDSRIFTNCALKQQLETRGDGQWLLGDGGYPCLPYLMTPLLRPTTRQERRYNYAQKRGRNISERTFGMWKRRFPCLNNLRVKLTTVFPVIIAVAVLWNITKRRNEPEVPGDEEEEVPGDDEPEPGPVMIAGPVRRQRIIQDHF